MNRYVFLDTNIYDEATFSFENPRMTALSKLIVDYNLSLLMCSVCKGEIKKHINDQLTDCVHGLNRQLRERYWASLRNNSKYEKKLKKLDVAEVISDVTTLFEEFLLANNVVYFTVNDIDVEGLVNDYFNQILPFESTKPDEFKDAIIVRALKNFQQTSGESIDIVSNDEGFRNSFNGSLGFEIFPSLDEWINKRQRETGAIQLLIDTFDELVSDSSIQEEIKEQILDLECSFDDRIDYSFDSSTLRDLVIDFDYAYFESENELLVMVSAESEIDVHATYLDEENSFYSSEEKDYVFTRYIHSEELHIIQNDILLRFSLITSDDDSLENDEDKFSYEYQGIAAFDYDYIALSEDSLLDIIDEESDGDDPANLVHCSQCGKVLGISENGCFFNSDYEPLCGDCAVIDEKGFICPICGLKHPHSDDSGDGTCIDCFKAQEDE